MKLSKKFESYLSVFSAHRKPAVHMTALKKKFLPWESHFGGTPYWLKGKELPMDEEGKLLCLVAQINLRQMPSLTMLPQKGILQFFLSDAPGASVNVDDPSNQVNLRTIYTPQITENYDILLSDEDYLKKIKKFQDDGGNFFDRSSEIVAAAIGFERIDMWPILGNMACAPLLKPISTDPELRELYMANTAYTHWLGGYSQSFQADPNELKSLTSFDTSLLHLGSDETTNLTWGDWGSASWFVESEKLAALDFSRVAFYEES